VKLGLNLLLTTLSKTSKQIGILVLSVVLTRYLTKTDYGTYLHVQLIANVAIWSFMLGIPHSVYYFLPRVKQQRRLLLATIGIVCTIAAIVCAGILLLGDQLALILNNPSLNNLILLTAGIAIFQIPLSIFEPTMIAANRVGTFIKYDSVFNITFFFVVFTPAVLTQDVDTILYSLVIYHGVQMLIILGLLIQTALQHDNNQEGVDYSVAEQFNYSLPIGLSQGIFELARYGDKVIVSHFFDPATLAVYARGAMDIPILSIVNNTIDNLMMPQLMEAYKNQCAKTLLHLWHNTIALTASFMYPSFFFLVFTAPYLIPGLYGDDYREAVPIFQIYSCGILFRVSTYNVIVRVIGKTGMMAWVATFSETANIIGTILLVQHYGLWGAPFATVLATGCIVLGYLIGISYRLKVSLIDIFPWKIIFGVGLLAGLAVVPLMPIHYLIQTQQLDLGNWSTLGIMSILYTFTYWCLMRFLPVLQVEHRDMLRSMLPYRLKFLV